MKGAAVFVAVAWLSASWAAGWSTASGVRRLDKKLIEYGWDVPFVDWVRDHIRQMERRPFDGLIFRLRGGGRVLEPVAWDEKKFQADFEAARDIRWRKFTDNFVIMWAASDQDWFNDDHWRAIVHNVRLVARAARLARCVGLCFDPEPYGPDPWLYSRAAHRDTKSFAQYEEMVRRRGAQFMRAVRAEMPRCVLLTFFQLSIFPDLLKPMDPAERARRLENHHYGLLPAFLNGMLDAAGDAVTIVDGNEGAYYYTKRVQYLDVYHRITQRALLLVDPALWRRYRTQVKVGQALYIDQYFGLRTNVKTYGHYMTPEERARWFEHNVYWALKTADKYVWCYSERMNWWKDQGVPPGCEEAIRSARRKVDNGQPLGFDIAPIIERARQRQRAEIRSRIVTRTATVTGVPNGVPPPQIDGALNDRVWSAVKPLEPFLPLAARPADKIAETRVWVTYDADNFYVAFRCAEPEPKKMRCVGTARDDPVWQGDSVEVLICPPGKTFPFYHFIINPAGVVWDGINRDENFADTSYNPQWQHAVRVGEKSWTVELAIPWRALSMSCPAPGEKLRADFCRQRAAAHELSAWSTTVRLFLEPELFGSLVFK